MSNLLQAAIELADEVFGEQSCEITITHGDTCTIMLGGDDFEEAINSFAGRMRGSADEQLRLKQETLLDARDRVAELMGSETGDPPGRISVYAACGDLIGVCDNLPELCKRRAGHEGDHSPDAE